MSLRREFVELAQPAGAHRRALCRRFRISPTTGYRWLRRYQAHGPAGLQHCSRRPHRLPQRATTAIEQRVLDPARGVILVPQQPVHHVPSLYTREGQRGASMRGPTQ